MTMNRSSEPKRSASTYDPTLGFLRDLWEQKENFSVYRPT
jgi:hypothetical protein